METTQQIRKRIIKFRSLALLSKKNPSLSNINKELFHDQEIKRSSLFEAKLQKKQRSISMFQKAKKILSNAITTINIARKSVKRTHSNSILKKFEKNIEKTVSDIPCGIHTFFLINSIHIKDQTFNIPLLPMIIFNCGLSEPVYSIPSQKLLFKRIQNIGLADKILSLMANNISINSRSSVPLFVVKFRECKRLYYSLRDLLESLPNSSSDCVIQKYITPKGLKAIKYRVILDKFKKVIIFSNKIRIDGKPDNFLVKNSTTQKNNPQDIERTVIMHREIIKKIKDSNDWKASHHTRSISKEKIFLLFHKNDEKKSYNFHQKKTTNTSARFLTRSDEDTTEFFEGKNQSFAKIIQITEYLKDKINNYYLDNTRITELAVDYLQDANGAWYMLKIKYGKCESKCQDLKKSVDLSKIRKKKNILRAINSLSKKG